MSCSAVALCVRDVAVAFGGRRGASGRGIDVAAWDVAAGAQVAVCGPSGSGKTTLLDTLAGLRAPDRGRVWWDGDEITAMSQPQLDRWRRARVGLVFQQFHLFPGLSALENVLLPFRFRGFTVPAEARRRVRDLLATAALPEGRRVTELSRGEMQRVALVRALATAPPVVLADEPTASLDRDTAAHVGSIMRAMCREARATLVVATHDPALAATLDATFHIAEGTLRGPAGEPAARTRAAA